MPVQVIEALPSVSVIPQAEPERRKLNAIGYARTSTTEQESSYESQLTYFEDLIRRNPDWNFCGMYSDESSGTSTKKRDGFNKMIRACEEGGVDIIVCKSLSRFSRNVVDAISQIRKLRELGVNLWLQKENVWTMEESGELLLVVLSSLAQAESQSISVNVMLGIRYKMQQGKPMINCSRFLGYDKDPISKKLVINPAEASTVRFIYRAFLEGFSIPEIAKKLREAHILTGSGKSAWSTDTVRYILSNEKYVGDLLMQKTYCKSFLTHRMVKNEGKLPQYFVQDNHDPVIPREIWNLAQSELVGRGKEAGHPGQRRYPLSGKVVCGCCGTEYKRFANARLLPSVSSTAQAETGTVNTLPAALPTASGEVENSIPATASGDVENSSATSGEVENSSTENSGAERGEKGVAVWKCKARVSRKDAAQTYHRLHSIAGGSGLSAASSVTHAVAGDVDAHRPASATDEHSAGVATVPESAADGMTWRCENAIVSEEKLQMAVDRALSLLPREEANIRLIREECLRVLRTSPAAAQASPSGRAAGRAADADIHSGQGEGSESAAAGSRADVVASAQLLLLHIDTTLSFLSGAGAGSGARSAGSGLPCTTFQQFVERSSATVPSLASESSGGRGGGDAIDLLIERVVIDGEKIRVVFKAGVEI